MPDLERANRLRRARELAGYARPLDAAAAHGWTRTYFSHENGNRGITRDRIAVYATAFRVRVDWLAYGQGPMRAARRMPIEGHLGDITTIEQRGYATQLDEIEAIEGISPDEFVAFRVHGNPYYPVWWDRDVLVVPRQHGPPDDYLGQRCIVTPADSDRPVIATLMPGSRNGLFTLYLINDPPAADVAVAEAAPIAFAKLEGRLVTKM